jgi:hypothetical protein
MVDCSLLVAKRRCVGGLEHRGVANGPIPGRAEMRGTSLTLLIGTSGTMGDRTESGSSGTDGDSGSTEDVA